MAAAIENFFSNDQPQEVVGPFVMASIHDHARRACPRQPISHSPDRPRQPSVQEAQYAR
ncbi:hypothetical protein ACCAA_680027 [Candidatus Accumulibacter aalborgensis]|uniref:Uncharacterized protein n=1 Tax=Candidatus Accumulibacter aalborgensis TaxID=1860102 RepID=A0A1A8XZ12_9PROT|nr:hypothetical protein ACCAA_680027 [Candidatus Accumulibacter aalborgensis]